MLCFVRSIEPFLVRLTPLNDQSTDCSNMIQIRFAGFKAMDIGKFSERIMSMSEEDWQRHMNPWSGWSRLSVLPLLVIAIWSHIWISWGAIVPIILVLGWTWINPRLSKAPHATDNWMSQGIMGERIWLAKKQVPIPDHHAKTTMVLNVANGVGLIILAGGIWSLDIGVTLAGMILSMGSKLWFLDRMVWLKNDMISQQESAEKTQEQD